MSRTRAAAPAVIRELVAGGELPTFARLMREGSWGPLHTLEPTLSPVIFRRARHSLEEEVLEISSGVEHAEDYDFLPDQPIEDPVRLDDDLSMLTQTELLHLGRDTSHARKHR